MGLKVFISSEMDTQKDKKRRVTAYDSIVNTGHIPIWFEDFSGRPFEEYEESAIDPCLEEVEESDLLLLIVDDDFSSGMKDEYETARECLGDDMIFYYFKVTKKRTQAVNQLIRHAKTRAIVKEFENNRQLGQRIIQSFSHYIKGKKRKKGTGPTIILDEDIELDSGQEMEYSWWLEEGEEYNITIIANGNVYAAFVNNKNYVRRQNTPTVGMFHFSLGTDKSKHLIEKNISQSDEYHLVIRNSLLGLYKNIHVRMIQKP